VLVRETVDAYLDVYETRAQQEGTSQKQLLEKSIGALQTELEEAQDAIADHLEEREDAGEPATLDALIAEIVGLQQGLNQAQQLIDEAEALEEESEARLEEIQQLQQRHARNPMEPIPDLGVEDQVMLSPSVERQRAQIQSLQAELSREEDQRQEGSKRVTSLNRQVDAAQDYLETEVKPEARAMVLSRLETEARERIREAQRRRRQYQATQEELQTELERVSGEVADVNQQEAEYERLIAEAEAVQQRLRRAEEVDYQRTVEGEAPVQGAIPQGNVYVNPNPDNGKRYQGVLGAILFSGFIAGLVGVLLELRDQSVRTSRDIMYASKLPSLANVPHARADRLPADATLPLLAVDYPRSSFVDELRRVLGRFIYPGEDEAPINSCIVTAPGRGDGTTTITCNLAALLAQSGRRVLLVDLGVRRASVEKWFELESGEGLSDVLLDGYALEDVAQPTQVEGLFVLGPGSDRARASSKLASKEMVGLIEEAESQFDHVLFDTPPVLLMSEARLVGPVVDAAVLVFRAGRTSLGMASRSVRELSDVGVHFAGAVLNGIEPTRWGYVARNREQYYDYAREEEEEAAAAPVDRSMRARPRKQTEAAAGFESSSEDEPGGMPTALIIEDEETVEETDADTRDEAGGEKPESPGLDEYFMRDEDESDEDASDGDGDKGR
jgi:capsular exopolysaccharide synthesis family protein